MGEAEEQGIEDEDEEAAAARGGEVEAEAEGGRKMSETRTRPVSMKDKTPSAPPQQTNPSSKQLSAGRIELEQSRVEQNRT